MQKIINFLFGSSKIDLQEPVEDITSRPIVPIQKFVPAPVEDDATRPSYRVSKHKTSEWHRVIDISG